MPTPPPHTVTDAEPTTHTVTSTDGLALHVRTWGDPTATPVVLLHGYPDTGAVWDGVARHLAGRHHVIVPDVRGAGASQAPETQAGYALDHLADDISAVVERFAPNRAVHLVGHDWGSIQGWEAVAGGALDGRVASYTTISGPSLDHVATWLRDPVAGRTLRGRRDRIRQSLRSWYIVAFHTPLATVPWRRGLARRWPTILERTEGFVAPEGHPAPTLARDGTNGVELYRANIRQRTRAPQDRSTDVPVQLLVPLADRFVTPAMADAALPHVTTVERRAVPDGHWGLLLGRPHACATLIQDFATRVDAGAVRPGRSDVGVSSGGGRFDDRLVVVTGAGSGIGRESALAFAALGAHVVCADRSEPTAAETVALVERAGGRASVAVVDVGDAGAMEVFADAVLTEHGVPDVVVNNAGIGMAGPFLDTTVDDWQQILQVNVWGVIHGCRLFGTAMADRGIGGHVVNLASAAAFVPSRSLPAYATTKAAVLMLSECLRAELADAGIGVTAVCPGIVATNITDTTRFVDAEPIEEAERRRQTTQRYRQRNYTPDRVAAAIVDAVLEDRAVVPVAPEAHALRAIGRFFPRVAERIARTEMV